MQKKASAKAILAALLAIIAAAGIGAGFWYFRYYTKTPQYAVKMIRESAASHDLKSFQKYVDTDAIVDEACNIFLSELLDSEQSVSVESRGAFGSFVKMFKPPLATGLRSAIYGFVKTGELGKPSEKTDDSDAAVDPARILEKTGLKNIEFHGADDVIHDGADSATVTMRVYQSDVREDFPLKVILKKQEDGSWRAAQIENLSEFIGRVSDSRRVALKNYLTKTDELMKRNADKTSAADRELVEILRNGSLGDMTVRRRMKGIMQDALLPAWTDLSEKLTETEPPSEAKPLHHLRLRIVQLRIEYAKSYSDWLESKDADTVKRSNELLREARTLEREAEVLARRLAEKIE